MPLQIYLTMTCQIVLSNIIDYVDLRRKGWDAKPNRKPTISREKDNHQDGGGNK